MNEVEVSSTKSLKSPQKKLSTNTLNNFTETTSGSRPDAKSLTILTKRQKNKHSKIGEESPEMKMEISNKNKYKIYSNSVLKSAELTHAPSDESQIQIRRDYFGNVIQKGPLKKHKITFKDKIDKCSLTDVVRIESHKIFTGGRHKHKAECTCVCNIF